MFSCELVFLEVTKCRTTTDSVIVEQLFMKEKNVKLMNKIKHHDYIIRFSSHSH